MPDTAKRSWQATSPARTKSLSDARLQLHYAAQFGTALGISYLDHAADDSHTNLGWDAGHGALVSRAAKGVAVGVRVADLTLLVLRDGKVAANIPLHAKTIEGATAELAKAFGAAGLDASRYTLKRHYELPAHPIAAGGKFNASDTGAFQELARWLGNASVALERIAATVPGASDVRLWPHHFDIATLVTFSADASTGAGLEMGDQYYDEPYFYVNARPEPKREQLPAKLAGNGSWHTHEWIGAVLPGSRVSGEAPAQEAQVRAFLDSALDACRKLVGG